jgi:hypothetical protein
MKTADSAFRNSNFVEAGDTLPGILETISQWECLGNDNAALMLRHKISAFGNAENFSIW